MNRATHVSKTSVPIYKALLSLWTHANTRPILIRASTRHGLVISHALPTQALPGKSTQDNHMDMTELLDELDKLIDAIDRYHESIRLLIEELKQDG